MHRLEASLVKDWRLLIRDWHAVLVLFAMPSAFVLIMSMALQNNFAGHQGLQLQGHVSQQDHSALAQSYLRELQQHDALSLSVQESSVDARGEDKDFVVRILPSFAQAYDGTSASSTGVEIEFAPTVGMRERLLIQAAAQEAFARFNTNLLANELGFDREYAEQELLKVDFIRATGESPLRPNSVQQNVPAWLIFAMFFIAIPISTTFIQERQQKTLVRLRTLGLPLSLLFAGKLLPYLAINLFQLALMLAIGAWLIPLLGGQALSLDVSLAGLLGIGLCVSFAALGYASLVASVARTVEQATVISGASNILFAALGGIMIPTFVMPPAMQQLSQVSPMAWGLNGFLEILVRGGNLSSVVLPCAVLTTFGLLCFLLSVFVIRAES